MKTKAMGLVAALTIMIISPGVYATSSCGPELGHGEENIVMDINYETKEVKISVNGSKDVCGNGKMTGEFVDYGQAEVQVQCKDGIVTITQDYDETILDIENLNLNLSDTRFMCDGV